MGLVPVAETGRQFTLMCRTTECFSMLPVGRCLPTAL